MKWPDRQLRPSEVRWLEAEDRYEAREAQEENNYYDARCERDIADWQQATINEPRPVAPVDRMRAQHLSLSVDEVVAQPTNRGDCIELAGFMVASLYSLRLPFNDRFTFDLTDLTMIDIDMQSTLRIMEEIPDTVRLPKVRFEMTAPYMWLEQQAMTHTRWRTLKNMVMSIFSTKNVPYVIWSAMRGTGPQQAEIAKQLANVEQTIRSMPFVAWHQLNNKQNAHMDAWMTATASVSASRWFQLTFDRLIKPIAIVAQRIVEGDTLTAVLNDVVRATGDPFLTPVHVMWHLELSCYAFHLTVHRKKVSKRART